MEPTRARSSQHEPTDKSGLPERARRLVRQRPLLTVAAATAVGTLVGGVFLSRLGRLVFAAAAGYVVNDLWRREGRLGIDDVVDRLSSR
jgi:hypothetical protein